MSKRSILSMITGIANACEILNKMNIQNNEQSNDKKLILPSSILDDCFNVQFQNSNLCLFLSCSNPDTYCEISLFNNTCGNRKHIYKYGYQEQVKRFKNFEAVSYEVNRVAASIRNTYKVKKEEEEKEKEKENDTVIIADNPNDEPKNNENNNLDDNSDKILSSVELVKILRIDRPLLNVEINLEDKVVIQVPKFNIVITCTIIDNTYITHLLRGNNYCSLVDYQDQHSNSQGSTKQGKCFLDYESLLSEIDNVLNYFVSKQRYKFHNCLFGPNCNDKVNCLYAHISSKNICFNGLTCTIKGCPFTHENNNHYQCRFRDKCRKMICYFDHPKTNELCRCGSKCRNAKCRFVH